MTIVTESMAAGAARFLKPRAHPEWKRCGGRRLHPYNSEYFIQCEKEDGHEHYHRLGNRVWSDTDNDAIVEDYSVKLAALGKTVFGLKRAMWEEK